jgi:hypothetical protein
MIPEVTITDFRIFNRKVLPGEGSPLQKEIGYAESVRLNHDQNFIAFEFAALNFRHPGKNQYKYMLEGLDRDWVYAETRRYAEYTGLRPGKYVFRVQGSNDDGLWNEAGARLEVIIRPPPWLSWYAWILYGLMCIGTHYQALPDKQGKDAHCPGSGTHRKRKGPGAGPDEIAVFHQYLA